LLPVLENNILSGFGSHPEKHEALSSIVPVYTVGYKKAQQLAISCCAFESAGWLTDDYLAFMLIVFGLTVSAFGRVTVRMPFSKSAFALSV
jgi:hypothetical protein